MIKTIGIWAPIIVGIFMGVAGSSLAKKKNRNSLLWFFICFCCGLLGLLPLACAKTLEYDEELDWKETDILSYVMLVIAIIWAILGSYITYMSAKAAMDAMYWDFFLGR